MEELQDQLEINLLQMIVELIQVILIELKREDKSNGTFKTR